MLRISSKTKGAGADSLREQRLGWTQLIEARRRMYVNLYEMTPFDRMQLVKAGAPSAPMADLAEEMSVTKLRLCQILGLSAAILRRKTSWPGILSANATERVVGLCRLVGMAEKIVEESGRPDEFEPARWFSQWLGAPAGALGGLTPGELITTADGREALAGLLGQMQTGA